MTGSLDLLQFQPIRFGFVPETCANNDNRDYCNLVQDGDVIQWQLRRISGISLGCFFYDIDHTQLLTNSQFTGSAAGWALTSNWLYGTFAANEIDVTVGTGSVTQNFGAMIDGGIYQIVVTTTITTVGQLEVYLSGHLIGTIPNMSIAGTYSFYGLGIPSTTTQIYISTGNNGIDAATSRVTSIEMYRAAPCFTIDVTSGSFNYDPSFGFLINGTIGLTITLPFEASSVYSPKTILTISGYQNGIVEFCYDGICSGALAGSNGDMTVTLNGSNNTVLGISFTDFIGNIDNIFFEQLSSDYYFSLNDLDGVFIIPLNNYITYCRDYIIGSFDPQAEGIFGYGCYRIGLYDPYLHTDQITLEYDFATLGAPWATVGGAVWTLTGGIGYEFDSVTPNGFVQTSETSISPFGVAWSKLKFETGTLAGGGIGIASMGIEISSPTSGFSTSITATAHSDSVYETASDQGAIFEWETPLQPRIFITGAIGGDHYEFKNAFYKLYPYHRDYLSNCFSYSQFIPCTKLIYAIPHNNLGFNTDNCSFAIIQRFRIVKIIPHYKIAATDFIGSDGTRVLISGTMQKFYILLFDYMGELAHDVVATILMSKVVYLYDTLVNITTLGTRYFVLPQEYTPEWEKDGKMNLAMGRIEIMEYNQVKTVTNCE